MENQINVEQPQVISQADLSHDSVVNPDVNPTLDNENGSTFGKFKDATSLLSAYNSLQAEFTRKSQKLAEAQKKIEDMTKSGEVLAQEIDKGLTRQFDAVSTENKTQDSLSQELNQENNSSFNSEVWKRRVDDFFSEQSDARDYSLEMGKILKKYPEIRKSNDALSIAYNLAKSSTIKKPADLVNDPKFIDEYVLTNDGIKSKIIQDYLSSVKTKLFSPNLINNNQSILLASKRAQLPKTIKEATDIVHKMFGGS